MPAAILGLVCAVLSIAGGLTGATPGAPQWAPAATATIHPGVQTFTAGAQCTANFVFASGTTVYLGQAAHCASTGSSVNADGCTSPSLPLGTRVRVTGATRPGVLAYSSWLTMQAVGETDEDACLYNDFALVRLHPADAGRVNPSVPHWGGPVSLGSRTAAGEIVYSYGDSELRLGLDLLNPKTGISLGDTGGGWSHTVLAVTPGLPGDSGSAVLDSRGRALGVLSTLVILPQTGTNGVGNLRRMLAYANTHTGLGARLALGTQPFTPNRLPLGGL